MVTRNLKHIQEALANRIEQLKDKPNFEALLRSYLEQIQDSENAALDITDLTTLTTATGAQLDEIGELVGEERFDRDDTDYHTSIEARILLILSEGTIEDILGLIDIIASGLLISITEYYPASFVADSTDPIDPALVDIYRIAKFIHSGKPAGVKGIATFYVADPFQFDAGLGYDDGKYAVAVEEL